ncbi:MAG: hypothetical protein FGM41_02635 [Bacteroidetes bacterium]|jgi:predicted lysophospholipase L1 biosynthesis ABC-type transport system permease subunit|nr:hypothetical protein [Bacteroidota bacterium]
MSNPEEQLEALKDIRNMMERSSRFLSLNGLSGIFVGIIALVGAAAAYVYLQTKHGNLPYFEYAKNEKGEMNLSFISFFLIDAVGVLIASLYVATWLTIKKAKKEGESVWNAASKQLMFNMAIPLTVGGLFCIIMVAHGATGMVAPATLVFYGLALVNASKFTFEHVKFLGLIQISLGLLAGIFINHGLLFWAIGFGVVHIAYGIIAYFTFEKN